MNHRAKYFGAGSLRRVPALWASLRKTPLFCASLLCVSVAIGACGGSEKVARGPAPSKVTWNSSEAGEPSGEPASEPAESADDAPGASAPAKPAPAPAAREPEAEPQADDGAIDLDALAASKAAETAAPDSAEEEEPEAEAAPAPSSDPVAAELQRRRNEKARRAGKGKKAAPKKKAAAPSATPAASAYTGIDPCRAATFNVAQVREACSNGGRPAAKRVMKDAIGKATANGRTLKCGDCHSNQRDYALKSNAVADLRRLLDT